MPAPKPMMAVVFAALAAVRVGGSRCTVTDPRDDNVPPLIANTLRWCVDEAPVDGTVHEIDFDLPTPVGGAADELTILLQTTIDIRPSAGRWQGCTDGIVIDAITQPDPTLLQPRSGPKVVLAPSATLLSSTANTQPGIKISGSSSAERASDPTVESRSVALRGLGFRRFVKGTVLVAAPGVTIEGALFADAASIGGATWVLRTEGRASNMTVRDSSFVNNAAVDMDLAAARPTTAGCHIGVYPNGTVQPAATGTHGIRINPPATNTRILRTTIGRKNGRGILSQGANLLIADSWVGAAPDGRPIPNMDRGIFMTGQIGQFQVLRTTISNNVGAGILVRGVATDGLIDSCHVANQTGSDGDGIWLAGQVTGTVVFRNLTAIYNEGVGIKMTTRGAIVEDCRSGINTDGAAAPNNQGNIRVEGPQISVRRSAFGSTTGTSNFFIASTATDASVIDCTIGVTADSPPTRTRRSGISVFGPRFRMSRTVIGNHDGAGVYLNAEDSELEDVRVGVGDAAEDIGCGNGLTLNTGATNAVLRNVTVGFSRELGIQVLQMVSGVSITSSHIGITADGVVASNQLAGIRGGAGADGARIVNTTVCNSGGRGIDWDGRSCVVDGCYVGTNAAGVIAGNGIYGRSSTARQGIYFGSQAVGSTVRSTVVANNGRNGIVSEAANTSIQDSFVGILPDGSCAQQNGNCIALINGAIGSAVEGSTIGSCGEYGVTVFNTAHNATIRNNRIGAPPSDLNCSVARNGVTVFGPDYPTITDNVVRFAGRSAIRVRPGTLGYTVRNNTESDPTNHWNIQACVVCNCAPGTSTAGGSAGVQVDCIGRNLGPDFPASFPANTTHILMPDNNLELLHWTAFRRVASTLQVLDLSNNPRLNTVPDFDATLGQRPFPALKVLLIGNTDFSRATANTLMIFSPAAGALYTLGLQGLAAAGRPAANLTLTGFGPELGVISWYDVTRCPAGYYSAVRLQEARLNPALYNQCIRCPVGTYQPTIGTDSYSTCERCGKGNLDHDDDPSTACEYGGEETMTISNFTNDVDAQNELTYLRYTWVDGGRILPRRKWAINTTYHIAPIKVIAINSITRAPIVVSFKLEPAPPGYFMNTDTGEVIGVPPALRPGQQSYDRTSTLYAVTSGLADRVLGTIHFSFAVRDVDPRSDAIGPGGLVGCANGGVRIDDPDDGVVEFDGQYRCDCAASGYQGLRCEQAAPAATDDTILKRDITLSVAGVIILGLSITVAVVVYKEKKRKWASLVAHDFGAEQDALVSSEMFSGLVATADSNGGGGVVIPRELPRKTITIKHELGAGAFGVVYMGMLRESGSINSMNRMSISAMPEYPVAVKSLKADPSSDERKEFLREALVSAQFDHENVVAVIGVITSGSPMYLVIQYCENGSLEGMLEKAADQNTRIPEPELVNYMLGVAEGMRYLAERHFVHRDLASRNVLVDNLDRPKVSDFGMSRDMDGGSYYTVSDAGGAKIPLRWSAPEALSSMKFSEKSDVWSYGITVVELYSGGEDPYRGWMNSFVAERVMAGFMHVQPDDCPRSVYDSIIVPCLAFDPHDRVQFADLVPVLTKRLDDERKVALTAASRSANRKAIEGIRTPDGVLMAKLEEIDGVRFTKLEAEMMRSFALISEDTAYDFLKDAKQREGDTAPATEVAGILLTAMELEMLDEVKAQHRAGYEAKAKQRTIADDVQTPDADGNYAYEFVPTANGDAAGQGGSSVSYIEENSAYEFVPTAQDGGYEVPASSASKAGRAGSADSQYLSVEESARLRAAQTPAYGIPASQQGPDEESFGFGFGFG